MNEARLYFIESKDAKKKLSDFKRVDFPLEKELQKLFEDNLKELLDLEFVESEFKAQASSKYYRIDTLAYERKKNRFVVIEYKKGETKNFEATGQAIDYVGIFTNLKNENPRRKAANAYYKKYLKEEKKPYKDLEEYNWDQLKIIVIAEAFTQNEIDTWENSSMRKHSDLLLLEVEKYEHPRDLSALYVRTVFSGSPSGAAKLNTAVIKNMPPTTQTPSPAYAPRESAPISRESPPPIPSSSPPPQERREEGFKNSSQYPRELKHLTVQNTEDKNASRPAWANGKFAEKLREFLPAQYIEDSEKYKNYATFYLIDAANNKVGDFSILVSRRGYSDITFHARGRISRTRGQETKSKGLRPYPLFGGYEKRKGGASGVAKFLFEKYHIQPGEAAYFTLVDSVEEDGGTLFTFKFLTKDIFTK